VLVNMAEPVLEVVPLLLQLILLFLLLLLELLLGQFPQVLVRLNIWLWEVVEVLGLVILVYTVEAEAAVKYAQEH